MIFPVCAKFGNIADHFLNKKKEGKNLLRACKNRLWTARKSVSLFTWSLLYTLSILKDSSVILDSFENLLRFEDFCLEGQTLVLLSSRTPSHLFEGLLRFSPVGRLRYCRRWARAPPMRWPVVPNFSAMVKDLHITLFWVYLVCISCIWWSW